MPKRRNAPKKPAQLCFNCGRKLRTVDAAGSFETVLQEQRVIAYVAALVECTHCGTVANVQLAPHDLKLPADVKEQMANLAKELERYTADYMARNHGGITGEFGHTGAWDEPPDSFGYHPSNPNDEDELPF